MIVIFDYDSGNHVSESIMPDNWMESPCDQKLIYDVNKKLGSKFYLEFKNKKELKKIIINLTSDIENFRKINKKKLVIKKVLNLQKIQDSKFSHVFNKTFRKSKT